MSCMYAVSAKKSTLASCFWPLLLSLALIISTSDYKRTRKRCTFRLKSTELLILKNQLLQVTSVCLQLC